MCVLLSPVPLPFSSSMEKKESAIHKIGRQALDTAIRHEIDGWPPYSIMGIYQPHRPETHPDSPQPQEKNNK